MQAGRPLAVATLFWGDDAVTAAELLPDPDQLAHFVNATFKHADRNGFVSLRAFPDSRNKGNGKPVFIEPVPLRHPQFHDVVVERARQAAKWHEPAVFCPPIVTFRRADNARADNILEGVCLSVDCDQEPVKAQTTLSRLLGRPTVTVKTGGVWSAPDGRTEHKRHMHWRLRQPTKTADEHKLLQEARELAVLLVGGDGTGITPVHPLRWPGSWHRKGEPCLSVMEGYNPDIEIDLHDALDKLRKATAHIAKAAPQPNGHPNSNGSSDQLARDINDVARAVKLLPNQNLPWDEWNKYGLAIHAATGGSDEGLQIFHQFSGRSSKYDADETEARWQHYHGHPAGRLGMGSLVYDARKTDPAFTTALPDITLKIGNGHDGADGDDTDLNKGKGNGTQDKTAPPSLLETRPASSFKLRSIRWLWPDRFALGKLGLIGGLPDKGKGLISCDLIACVTANRPLPCNEGTPPQGSVVYFTAEDDIEDTVVPRLIAAGADLERVHIVRMMKEQNKKRPFSILTDLPALQAKIEEINNVVLVIIDPMSAYVGVGKVNTLMTTDVRGFLQPLCDLAAEKAVSILGVMHFNKKADVTNAMLRIADSLAYVAAARHVYVVVDDTEVEHRRLFVKAKNNLAPDKNALSYMTGVRYVGNDPQTNQEIHAPYIEWGSEHIEVTANEAMQAEGGGNHSKLDRIEAETFLRERLASGPIKQQDIIEEAEANNIAERTLRRAKKKLGVKSHKQKGVMTGEWMWEMPATNPHYTEDQS
jgi:hypothetical protein